MRVLHIMGTRPEAIKMAPVVKAFQGNADYTNIICSTGQHKQMLDQITNFFDISLDFDLQVMSSSRGLSEVTSNIVLGLKRVMRDVKPNLVLVHGDTNTTVSASLSAYYHQIPIGHVEAGLRSGNLYAPWPEEGNRKITDSISSLCFAPTEAAKRNLLTENVASERVAITGNTVIDALKLADDQITSDAELRSRLEKKYSWIPAKRVILVTGHRRENFGEGFQEICRALRQIASSRDVQVIYPVHLNPNVSGPVHASLLGLDNLRLLPPLEYPEFVYLMKRSYLILTDSGGIQEEAPTFGKPVLVMRDTTERPEAIEAGTAKLVGAKLDSIVSSVLELIDDPSLYSVMSGVKNPFGDGEAANRILSFTEEARAMGLI